jgi:hypothetical protein
MATSGDDHEPVRIVRDCTRQRTFAEGVRKREEAFFAGPVIYRVTMKKNRLLLAPEGTI